MAAESSRKTSKSVGLVVRPQTVSDKSYVESVVGFINDVVPQTKPGEKEVILWVKFEYCDINDHSMIVEENDHNGNNLPLLIILGYANGIQVWCVSASGDAQEVLSWRQGPVRVMRILPTPESGPMSRDKFAAHRPLAALCDSTSAGEQFCYINFISLKSGDRVDGLKFPNPVADVKCNKRVIVTIFTEKIMIHDACNLKEMFSIISCYPATSLRINPVALGTRWLAFADRKFVESRQTSGGMASEGVQSYTATVLNAAKTITKGLSMFSATVANSIAGAKPPTPSSQRGDQKVDFDPGVVTILDVMAVNCSEIFREKPKKLEEVNIEEDSEVEGIVAHFVAHASEPIAALAFDPSGMLLLTSCALGHNFNVFRIFPHPASPTLGAVHHLYTLHRGDTTAKVQDVAFSLDSRWVAVSTLRGTTHIFPITPYGGQISVRTHTSPRVVNRLSRFHRSAGLEDMQHPVQTGRNSPVLSGGPGSSSGSSARAYDSHPSLPYPSASSNRMGNSRLPPYPQPITLSPLFQIKQSLTNPLSGTNKPKSPVRDRYSRRTPSGTENVCLAAAFAPARAWLVSSPSLTREKREKLPADSLYVIDWHGSLIEYMLEPRAVGGSLKADDTPIELYVSPHAQWNLLRPPFSSDIQPPLQNSNPLMQIEGAKTNTPRDERTEFGYGSGTGSTRNDLEEGWLSQVEIITHAGPHRRLWMGPQFSFQTFQHHYNTTVLSSTSSALLSQSPDVPPTSASAIFTQELDVKNLCARPARSNPMEMPGSHQSIADLPRSPLLIEASSGSFEQIPHMLEVCNWPDSCGGGASHCKNREELLIEHIADAMTECTIENLPSVPRSDTNEFRGSYEELSSSSSQSGSVGQFERCGSFPHGMEHAVLFPTSNGSPDSS